MGSREGAGPRSTARRSDDWRLEGQDVEGLGLIRMRVIRFFNLLLEKADDAEQTRKLGAAHASRRLARVPEAAGACAQHSPGRILEKTRR